MPTRPAVPAPATEPPAIRAERYRVRFDSRQPCAPGLRGPAATCGTTCWPIAHGATAWGRCTGSGPRPAPSSAWAAVHGLAPRPGPCVAEGRPQPGNPESNRGLSERWPVSKAGALWQVDSAYTSQTCAACGHVGQANRTTRAWVRCMACGHTANADHHAAVHIVVRGVFLARPVLGVGAAAWRGAFPSGTPTTREPVRRVPARAGPSGPAPVPSVNSSV